MKKIKSVDDFLSACKDISKSPFDRINPKVKKIIDSGNYQFENHCHIFNHEYVPVHYMNLRLSELPSRIFNWFRARTRLVEYLYEKDRITGIDDFIRNFFSTSMKEVLERLMRYFPDNFIFSTLTMDMSYGWDKLESTKDFKAQIKDMKELVKANYPVLPFLAIDPRNPNLYQDFIKAFTGKTNFFGVKVYPALGYLPSDPVLMNIYEVCEKKNIPVTTHCGGTIIRSMQNVIELEGFVLKRGILVPYKKTIENKRGFISERDVDFLNDPDKWLPVIKKYPNLRLNLGHYGGMKAWKRNGSRISTIKTLMNMGENVYADFSFNLDSKKSIRNFVKKMKSSEIKQERSLFGTDFYMVTPLGDFHNILQRWKENVPDYIDTMMKRDNPHRFYFSKN